MHAAVVDQNVDLPGRSRDRVRPLVGAEVADRDRGASPVCTNRGGDRVSALAVTAVDDDVGTLLGQESGDGRTGARRSIR